MGSRESTATEVDRLTSKEVVNLDGDGSCDSPGHCAKYGTYTLMDEDSGDVVAFNVVQVSEVSSSNALFSLPSKLGGKGDHD